MATEPGADSCAHCAAGTAHPVFACFLSDRRFWGIAPGASCDAFSRASHWDVDTQPVLLLGSYNRDRRLVVGPKVSRAAAPHHQTTLLIGPFASARAARIFVATISSNSRKFNNRLVRGVCLAQAWHEIDAGQATPLRIACPDAGYLKRIRALCREAKNAGGASALARQLTHLLAAAHASLVA